MSRRGSGERERAPRREMPLRCAKDEAMDGWISSLERDLYRRERRDRDEIDEPTIGQPSASCAGRWGYNASMTFDTPQNPHPKRNRSGRSLRSARIVLAGLLLACGCRANRAAGDEVPARLAACEAALAKTVDIDVADMPLAGFVDHLSRTYGIPVRADYEALEKNSDPVTRQTPVSIKLAGACLESALRLALRPIEVGFTLDGDGLLITSLNGERQARETRLYPVADLLRPDEISPPDYDSLIDQVTNALENDDSWTEDDQDADASLIRDRQQEEALEVRTSRAIHGKVQTLLADLRRVRDEQRSNAGGNGPAPAARGMKLSPVERIERALAKRVDLDLARLPLSKFADLLSRSHGIPVWLDARTLASETTRFSPDTPVSVKVSGVSLESALRLALKPLDLGFTIDQGVLVIPIVGPEELVEVHVYPVADLVRVKPGDLRDNNSLIEVIMETSTVDPGWPDGSGPGPLREFWVSDSLTVPITRSMQRQIARLLVDLRKAQRVQGPTPTFIEGSAAETAIERALASPVTLDLVEVPLAELADYLRETYKISVVLDELELEEGADSVTPQTRVTVKASAVPLEAALRQALDPIDAAATVEDEALILTSSNAAEATFDTRVYPVGDLVPAGPNGQRDYEPLCRQIQLAVPDKPGWAEKGGYGVLKEFALSRAIVVSQSPTMHRRIAKYLEGLRKLGEGD